MCVTECCSYALPITLSLGPFSLPVGLFPPYKQSSLCFFITVYHTHMHPCMHTCTYMLSVWSVDDM